jgi:FG-GAP-like repeat/Calx-beta domain/Carboxypeptidase regulatory-like domain/FG-GAP repeat
MSRSSRHLSRGNRNVLRCLIVSVLMIITLLPAGVGTRQGTAAWEPRLPFGGGWNPWSLGNYANTSVQLGANTTVTPDAAPTATTSINVSTSTNFKGRLEGDPTTGIVRVTDAHPAGTYMVTVTAFDGEPSLRTFTLTVTTPATCNPLTFAAANFGAAAAPIFVAVGDFNGDLKQDLAVANDGSNNVSILLGNGAGSFGGATNFAVGGEAFAVAVGDFNGDGDQDLAVGNRNSTIVSVLMGNGAGGFGSAVDFTVGLNPLSLAVGDFNSDGKQDLAVANKDSNDVSVLLGNGAGSFSAAAGSPFAAGSSPHSVAVGDFNGDGKQDLAFANYNTGTASVLMGNGAGSFSVAAGSPFSAGSNPRSVVIGDFNGDGKQDIAIPNSNSNNVSILLGNGTGAFGSATNFPAGDFPISIALGDFNGDGKQDVATANTSSDTISVLLGNGAGSFSSATNFSVGSSPRSLAVGDFNGDGKQDFATANAGSDNASVLLRQCAPPVLGNYANTPVPLGGNTLITPDAAPASTTSINISTSTNFKGKLEGDPTTGIVRVTDAHPAGAYTVTATAFNGAGGTTMKTFTLTVTTTPTCNPVTFAAATTFSTGTDPFSVAVGDFNGDGKQDLAVANHGTDNASVLLGDGVGGFNAATNFAAGSGPLSVAVGDFNGDGKQDLATANGGANKVSIFRGDGAGSFNAATNFATGNGPFSVAVGDFNSDARQDLAVANTGSGNVSVLLGDGAGSFGAATNFGVGSAPRSVAVGDFNGDGKQDLAVANVNSNNASVLLGNGSGSFSAATNFAVGSQPRTVTVGDFNSDGKQDLAVANEASNNVSVLLGNGAGGFAGATNFSVGVGNGPFSVALGDFDGDGKQDIATSNPNSNNVSVLSGNGAGSFNAASNFAVGSNPTSIAVGDFNGDGKQDLVTANESSNNVSVLLRQCAPVLGNYSNTAMQLGANTTIAPDAAPTSTTSINVATSTNFKGKLEGDPATGVVRVTDAHPEGAYTVTVTAFNGAAGSTTKTFTLTVTTPATCNPVTFGSAANFGAGTDPRSVAVGDLNGDGKQDFAVANTGSNNVSVLLGNGAGSFGAIANFGVGGGPLSVAVGDFDGDGKQDLATANSDTANGSVLLGNGAGGFSAAANFGVGSQPRSVAVGDFNGDAKQDLAFANTLSDDVSILLGNGAGSFGAATNFSVGDSPLSVVVGDFNVDGKQDLAVANDDSDNISVLLGDGAGSFGPATNFGVGSPPRSVAVGDFNADGKQDLVSTSLTASNVSVLLGNGLGAFGPATTFGVGSIPQSVAVADLNGDGKQDLAVANNGSANLSVLLGDGTGSFSAASNFGVGNGPYSVAVGDFNGDGKQDLAAANQSSNHVSVLLRQCAAPTLGNYANTSVQHGANAAVTPDAAPTFTTSINVSTSTAFKGTLEGDPSTGAVHITDAHPAGMYIVTVTAFDGAGGNATKTFTLTVTTPVTCNPLDFARANFSAGPAADPDSVAVGDFNRDGKQDLVIANANSNKVSILLGNGAGSFSAAVNFAVDLNPRSVAVGDFNRDGKQDLVTANQDSSSLSVLLGNGTGSFGAATNFFAGDISTRRVTVGDFNGDGSQDLAATNNAGNVSILTGNGSGSFTFTAKFDLVTRPIALAVGDFNGDGKQDLASANQESSTVKVLLGNGASGFGPPATFHVGAGPVSVVVGDFNGDSKQDLATANNAADSVSILLGDGAGSFSAAVNFGAGNRPVSVVVGDFNGDSNQDLAIANSLSADVSILLGDGAASFSAPVNFDVGMAVLSVAVGDFNGDGKQDFATANSGSNDVSVLLRQCPPANILAVINNNSFGAGSLERAINDSNANAGADTIVFQIPGAGVRTISLTSPLPGIFGQVIIDGATQPGYAGTPLIELNGVGAGGNGLNIFASLSAVRGLIINRFAGSGIILGAGTGGNTIAGCYIGTNAAGTAAASNGGAGIQALGSANNQIGGSSAGDGNIIAFNGSHGVGVNSGGTGNRILSNSIHDNGTLGIDLNEDGVTGNDAGDTDTGANTLQNSPVLTTASSFGVNTIVQGTLNSTANMQFTIEFFANPGCDPSGNGEGQVFLSSIQVTTDASGNVSFNPTLPSTTTAGQTVTATATDPSGNTSEFSACRQVTATRIIFSGRVLDDSGNPLSGVTVTLNGSVFATTITDGAGNYSFASATGGGNYTVTPSSTAYSFSPLNQTFSNLNVDRVVNFVGTRTVSITGKVTDAVDAPINNVTVALTRNGAAAGTVLTNVLGDYSFGSLAAGANYVVTPVGTFTPSTLRFNNLTMNATANFKAAPSIPPQCNGVSFGPRTNFAAGSNPGSVAAGDFNGDGKLDLAVTNHGSSSTNISVLLGDGAGGFAAATNFSVGTSPFLVALGDFNGDGKSDLAVANEDSNDVSVRLGDGAGGFAAATNFSVGVGPQSVAVGDFNGDFKQDLATANANPNSNNVSVLLGNGAGSFAAAQDFGAGSGPVSVAAGDFNNDGKSDLAVANDSSNNVSVLLRNAGSFAPATNFAVGSTPVWVATADFNGDGKLDLAVANVNSNDVSVLLGNGLGNFGTASNFGVGVAPRSVALGDFNGDGKLDLAVANETSNNLSVLLGDGAGSFAAATNFAVGINPFQVAAGDFNGDGKLDLAAANGSSANVSILLNNTATCNTQASLTISGQVTASNNSPLSDVAVLLSGSITRLVRTDLNGNYSLSSLTPGGNYSLTIDNPYSVFSPSRLDFFNLSTHQIANFVAAANAVPAPTPSLSDDFNADTRDPNKWNLSTLTFPASSFDPLVTTAQVDGKLIITPLAQASGLHYNGYVSARLLDMRNGQASVELSRAATGGADTIFGIGSDSDNFFRFLVHTPAPSTSLTQGLKLRNGIEAPLEVTTAQLILQVKLNGQLTALNVDYSSEQHRFIRFRHESLTNSMVFETSPDADFCSISLQHRVILQKVVLPRGLSISTMIAELSAGTSSPTNPGTAAFDNFGLVTSTYQFSARGYTVREGGSALITVTRTGNTETAGSVDFATADGTAHQGINYNNTANTLTFASGEVSKSFRVQTLDSSAEGNLTVNLRLLNPVGSGFGRPARAVLTIVASAATGNPLDDVQFFVNQQYVDFLDRQPDPGGLGYWTTQIAECGNAQCINSQRINVSAAFFVEAEFQQTGSFVYRLFKGALGRQPKYAEFISDRGKVAGGRDLTLNKTTLLDQFVRRTEFQQRYPCSLSNTLFVNRLFDTAGLMGQDFDSQRLVEIAAMTAGKTRAQVVGDVIEIQAFKDREYKPSFVLMQYFGYLRRDLDPQGYEFWLDVITNRDPGNYRAMVCAFITSAEYQHRFSLVATHNDTECQR